MSDISGIQQLYLELKCLLGKKPAEDASSTVQDEYFLKVQAMFLHIITLNPVFAVENKLELDMWSILYKTKIGSLQNSLHQICGPVNNKLGTYTTVELKLRLVLLLDRASGIYFTLIHQLLQLIADYKWPKLILHNINFGMNMLVDKKCGHNYLDLDLTSLYNSKVSRPTGTNLWYDKNKPKSHNELFSSSSSTTTTTSSSLLSTSRIPRILSRGDRLPSELTKDNSLNLGENTEKKEIENQNDTNRKEVNSSLDSASSSVTITPKIISNSFIDYETAIIYLIQHCLVHLGDLARYRQQSNVAAGYYLWAWVIHPDSGHSYNQLAILENLKPSSKRCLDALFYYYVRAVSCSYPFPVALNNLTNMIKENPILNQSFKEIVVKSRAVTKTMLAGDNNDDNINSSKNVIKTPLHQTNSQLTVLLKFYSLLLIHSDSQQNPIDINLLKVGQYLHSNIDYWSSVNLNRSEIIHIVCIHLYFLDRYIHQNSESHSLCSVDLNQLDNFLMPIEILLLLSITTKLINWFAKFYVEANNLHQQMLPECDSKQNISQLARSSCKSELLIGINLLFLWLRLQNTVSNKQVNTDSHIQLKNSYFELINSNLSKNVTILLNSLISYLKIKCDSSFVANFVGNSLSDPSVESMNWCEMMKIPEILLLQGFQPLTIPTQRVLCKSNSYKPLHPFLVYANCCTSYERSKNELHNKERLDKYFCTYDCFHESIDSIERIICLITSARLVSQHYPSLINWLQNEADVEINDSAKTNKYFDGEFAQAVQSSSNRLNELIENFRKKNEHLKSTHTTTTTITSTTTSVTVSCSNIITANVTAIHQSDTQIHCGKLIDSNSKNLVNNGKQEEYMAFKPASNTTNDITATSIAITGTTTIATNLDCKQANIHETQLIKEHSDIKTDFNDSSNVQCKLDKLSDQISNLNISSFKNTKPDQSTISSSSLSNLSTSTLLPNLGQSSGGLILNAELAKFIQEQAIQVAERQQKIGQSSSALPPSRSATGRECTLDCMNTDTNKFSRQKSSSIDNNNNNNVGSNNTNSSLAKCFGTQFRNDLPPRFAKRLQAELLEKEAQIKQMEFEKNKLKFFSSSLDHPAPLARKESEGVCELNSLLSSTDSNILSNSNIDNPLNNETTNLLQSSSSSVLNPHLIRPTCDGLSASIHYGPNIDYSNSSHSITYAPTSLSNINSYQQNVLNPNFTTYSSTLNPYLNQLPNLDISNYLSSSNVKSFQPPFSLPHSTHLLFPDTATMPPLQPRTLTVMPMPITTISSGTTLHTLSQLLPPQTTVPIPTSGNLVRLPVDVNSSPLIMDRYVNLPYPPLNPLNYLVHVDNNSNNTSCTTSIITNTNSTTSAATWDSNNSFNTNIDINTYQNSVNSNKNNNNLNSDPSGNIIRDQLVNSYFPTSVPANAYLSVSSSSSSLSKNDNLQSVSITDVNSANLTFSSPFISHTLHHQQQNYYSLGTQPSNYANNPINQTETEKNQINLASTDLN